MAEYLAPGVYVEEVELGGKPIEGVSTSTAGFIGLTERGPTEPSLVSGFAEFRRLYGGNPSDSYLPYAVDGFFANGGKRCFIARVCGKNSKDASGQIKAVDDKEGAAFEATAVGPGDWGNRVAVKIEDASLSLVRPELFKLTVVYWTEVPPVPLVDPTDPSKRKEQNRREPSLLEIFDNLSPDPASADFYEKKVNDVSALVTLSAAGDGTAIVAPARTELVLLEDGASGQSPRLADYEGDLSANPGERSGLAAFAEVDEISLVSAPNENDVSGLTDALVEHCELLRDRFAILQAAQDSGGVGQLRPSVDSKFAAVYYPWVSVIDPLTQRPKLVPPGGHVAGIYARCDTERGVHKAPANEAVRGIVGLQFTLTKGDQEILNPRGVNCIRTFPGRGIRVWGARTVSSDPAWRYINVRRLFLYLEESIEEGTQWVVFEPNDQRLWARVRQSVTDFLTRVWRDGALMGNTAAEAFFVKCDETTMSPDDIDNGRLVVLVGVAPVPAGGVRHLPYFAVARWL